MSKEIPLQANMFSDDLVDTRTRKQKNRARQLTQPHQIEMFSQRELAQFGVRAHPKLSISPKTRLELTVQDGRTEEEKAQDSQLDIERRTYPIPGIHEPMAEVDLNKDGGE